MRRLIKQAGQSMAEYTVVVVALVSGLLIANEGCTEYDSCIEAVLVAMHDNYSGYAGSMSSVHEYATDYEVSDSSSGWGDDDDGDDGSGSSGGGSGSGDVTGLTEVTSVTSNAGFYDYGYLQSDGSVTAYSDSDSEVQGYYDSDTGEYTDADTGVVTAVDTDTRVQDEDGNILQMHAFTSCSGEPVEVYGFGYQSEATGTYYDTSYDEQDLGSNCWHPTYTAYTDSGDSGGRIVDGNFYAVTATPYSDTPITPTGEMVYWDFGSLDENVYQYDDEGNIEQDAEGNDVVLISAGAVGDCAVMISGWDDSVDTSQSDENIFEDQLQLYSDAKFATQDSDYYVEQTVLYGETNIPWVFRGDCVTQRVLTNP